ncbi:MAG: acyl-[ACP]--phospholipid O-acyltransferase [Alphaproteobacteria bacterium]|nr:acyl-[ACP]--phospholipid O-acyltransferase [Alphaproteobacteria bacterium]
MSKELWKTKRFLPLLVTQFFGAFNDNLFKNTLMTFVAYKMIASSQTTGIYANVMAGVFILPYFLFSALAGLLADKYNRAQIARCLKITELLLMLAAGGVFALQNINALIFILFLMGVQSTFFGPIKYALLPQLLKSEELVAGNAYIEATTYISIITGSILGTLLPVYASLTLLIICAVIGIIASYKIPQVPGLRPDLKLNWNIFRQVKDNLRLIRSHPIVFRAIIGATWFWILGAFFLTELFPLCSKVFNTEPAVVTLFLILFSVGVGAGSVFCNRLLKGEVSVVYVPLSAVGLSICAFLIYVLSAGFEAPQEAIGLGQFLLMPRGLMLSVCLFAFAFMGGLYIVPLNTLMQVKAPKKQTASVIAGNNIINALGMVAISLFAVLLIAFGFKITDLFLFVAFISAAVAFYICRLLPDALIRSIFCTVLDLFFRVKVDGLQNLRQAGSKVLIIANHVSLLDGILVAAYLPRKITFAIDSDWGSKWYVKIFSGLVDFYPLNPANPLSVRSLIEVINQRKTVMIFPEGRISVTGSLMKVYEGSGMIANKTGAKMVPLRIDGAQYSKFSYLGKILKTKMFPQIKLSVLPACKIDLPEGLSARERRRLTSLKMRDIMADMMYTTTEKDVPIFNAVLQAEKIYGKKHPIAVDIMKKTLNYGQFLLKTYVLGTAYKKVFRQEEKIGVLLPNSLVGAVNFFALQFGGKIPVMLNFSLGDKQFSSCLKTAGLKTVITAHKFIEQGQLQRLEQDVLQSGCRLIYLEDLAKQIGIITKLKGLKKYLLRQQVQRSCNQTAAILFTSGSEGLPKAVLLSHKNLIANVLQLHLAVPFNARDVILNALPMFHSFGLTVGTILPFLYGLKTYFYPSPLHYRIIPEVAYEVQATAVLGTDTFLYGYGRMANAYDFFSVRFAIVGGEKLKDRTQELWMKKFGIRIFEGYGTTETAPVLSVNTPMFYRENTVGRLLPCIEYKLEPVNGVDEGGRLLVKGDNVMQGYMLADNPEVLQPAPEWYDTGDIVNIDEEGFVHILGRAKRFAKIGGEMVSLTAVEQLVDQLYPEAKQGVLAIADERKGEKLVLVTSAENAAIKDIQNHFRTSGVSELWIPKEVVYMKKPPLLGSGKFDYQEALHLLQK